jgi:hypothetical protein
MDMICLYINKAILDNRFINIMEENKNIFNNSISELSWLLIRYDFIPRVHKLNGSIPLQNDMHFM